MVRIVVNKGSSMAPTGRPAAHAASAAPVGTLLSSLVRAGGRNPAGASADLQTAQSLARVGLLGLASLPVLMLASIAVHAPIAGPAVIALGYLGAAQALAAGQPRRAAGWTCAVLGGLVAWAGLSMLLRYDMPSWPDLAAALLAPILAAAPALSRHFAAGGRGKAHGALPRNDEFPDPAIATDRDRLPASDPNAMDPATADPHARVSNLDLVGLHSGASRSEHTALLEPGITELQVAPPIAPTEPAPGPAADLLEAIGFALRHVGPRARAQGMRLTCSAASGIPVAADRQICRRILCVLLGEAVRASAPGDSLHIEARPVRGAVLLRLCSHAAAEADRQAAQLAGFDVTGLRDMVEAIGGTVLITDSADGRCVSLRLARAGTMVRQGPRERAAGVS